MIQSMKTQAAMVHGGAVDLGANSWCPLTMTDMLICAVPAMLLLALVWIV